MDLSAVSFFGFDTASVQQLLSELNAAYCAILR